MSLYLIKGQYRIVHSEPDGDSVHFIPGNADAFTSLHLNARLGDARTAKSGVWAADATTGGATITTLADLTDRLVIMPKLFRRLAEYFALSVGSVSLDGFAAFMASHDDRLYVISDAHATGFDNVIFDNVITVAGQTVSLDEEIADLIFTEGYAVVRRRPRPGRRRG
jgi:hypothetical protein